MSTRTEQIIARLRQHPSWHDAAVAIASFDLNTLTDDGSHCEIIEALMRRAGVDVSDLGDDFIDVFSGITKALMREARG